MTDDAMDPMESIKQTYFQECDELLVAMEEGLIAIEAGEADHETINAVFRAVHSIKGGGGAFGFTALVAFSHEFETAMDHLRSNRVEPRPDIAKVLLRAGDVLSDLVRAARDNEDLDPARSQGLIKELSAISPAGESGAAESAMPAMPALPAMSAGEDELGFRVMTIQIDSPEAPAAGAGWTVVFTPHKNLYANANEPSLLLRQLASLGEAEVTADLSRIPSLSEIDPDQSYLSWTIQIRGEIARADIEETFEFVVGDCDLSIEEMQAAAEGFPAPEPAQLDVIAEDTSVEQASTATASPAAATSGKDKQAPTADNAVKATIRVDLDKVDRLVNLVGELVITQAMLSQRVYEAGQQKNSLVANGLAELERLLRELQEGVMAIRTQPVKSVFQRMPRLVREVARQTNKQVKLVLEGEATEVDKTVIERIGEPLTHMLRNAIDHGLETAEERRAAGKPEEGTIMLSAEHRGGRIMIEVSDDGRGIDRARVRAKAIERNLIAADAILSDEEIDNLIFMPGFSTADQVSDISGRGVGMDVVRRNIVELGGRIVISSQPGKGSRFGMTLPLTLAVLDGMVVCAGDQTFVLPLSHVVESLRPRQEDIRSFGDGSLLRMRNVYIPLVSIGELLDVGRGTSNPTQGVTIIVESQGVGRFAIAVDSIVGQRQVVIKSFERNYRHIDGIAAATILGDGRVALILDVDGLVTRCREMIQNRNDTLEQPTGTGP